MQRIGDYAGVDKGSRKPILPQRNGDGLNPNDSNSHPPLETAGARGVPRSQGKSGGGAALGYRCGFGFAALILSSVSSYGIGLVPTQMCTLLESYASGCRISFAGEAIPLSLNAPASALAASPSEEFPVGQRTQTPATVRPVPTIGMGPPPLSNVGLSGLGSTSTQRANNTASSISVINISGSISCCISKSNFVPGNFWTLPATSYRCDLVRLRGNCEISQVFSSADSWKLIQNSAATPITTKTGNSTSKNNSFDFFQLRDLTDWTSFQRFFRYSPIRPTATNNPAASNQWRYVLMDSITTDGSDDDMGQNRKVLEAFRSFHEAQKRDLIIIGLVVIFCLIAGALRRHS